MIDFGGDKASIPPSCLVSIYAKNNDPDTVPMLNYSVPLKGVSEAMEIFINRSLRNFSGKLGLTWPGRYALFIIIIIIGAIPTVAAAIYTVAKPKSDPNIGKCAQDGLKKNSGDLKDLLSRSEATFRGIAGACREVKIINSFEYDEIFDGMTRQTLAERVDQFLEGIMLVLKYHPKQLGVFLNILIDKGNIAFVVVAERIAQSCKLSIII